MNNPDNNIIIDDNYQGAYAEHFENVGIELDSILDSYISIVNELLETQGLKGEIATALREYTSKAETLLGGKATTILSEQKQSMNQLFNDIATADADITY